MRVLFVTGDRNWDDPWKIRRAFDEVDPGLVIEGKAPGADTLAGREARIQGALLEEYPADWRRFRRAAGPIRNAQMCVRLEELRAEGHEVHCYAFHPDLSRSRGTADMVAKLKAAGFEVKEVK